MPGLIIRSTGLTGGAGLSVEPALADSPGLWENQTSGPVMDSFLLLADQSSLFLLADNSSFLIIAGH